MIPASWGVIKGNRQTAGRSRALGQFPRDLFSEQEGIGVRELCWSEQVGSTAASAVLPEPAMIILFLSVFRYLHFSKGEAAPYSSKTSLLLMHMLWLSTKR